MPVTSFPACTSDEQPQNVGWICPACNKGNAPWAVKCWHCADADPISRINPFYDPRKSVGGTSYFALMQN